METHHWRDTRRDWQRTLWLVRLCGHCHRRRVHRLSLVMFRRRTAGLWLTTPAVVWWGKLGQRFGWSWVPMVRIPPITRGRPAGPILWR